MTIYRSVLTDIGAAEIAIAHATGGTVTFTHLAVGDGGGAAIDPVKTMASLVHEVHRVAVNQVTPDHDHPGRIIVEAVLPKTVGGWTIREVGVIGNGRFMVVGNFPDTYKPVAEEGTVRDQVIRVVVQLSNTGVVQITLDGSSVVVTDDVLRLALEAHVAAVDPHPQYFNRDRIASRLYFFGQL